MNDRHLLDEDTEPELEYAEVCEDCPNPDGCIRRCSIASYVHEDVAHIRGEDK